MTAADRINLTIPPSSRAAMATTSCPTPFDALLPLLVAAQRTWGWPVSIEVTFSGGMKVSAPVAPAPPVAHHEEGIPDLSDKQKAIVKALLAHGPLKGDALAQKTGYKNRETLSPNRGLKELKGWGLVVVEDEGGYALTDLGEEVASRVSEEEE